MTTRHSMTMASTFLAACAVGLPAAAWALGEPPASQPASSAKGAALKATAGADVGDWLKSARENDSQPAGGSAPPRLERPPLENLSLSGQAAKDQPLREDALPGVVELSSGQVLAGWLYTTREKPLEVYVEKDRQWRQVPLIALLGITAKVVEEKMEAEWRWKEMGVPERVYTGREYPTRRLTWRVHLIDDSVVGGAIKGQPLWVEYRDRKSGPFLLAERTKGELGQKLADLVYIKHVIVSRRMMDAVLADQAASQPAR